MTRRLGWRDRAAVLTAWAWDRLGGGRHPVQAEDAPLPSVPPGGGDWTAHLAPDGAWPLREAGSGRWFRLSPGGFHSFRAQVAAAGGCMLTIEEEPGERDGAVQVRRRTVGYWLDGDTREQPAVLRRRGGMVEYYFYRRGNPMGYERLGLSQGAGDAAQPPRLPQVAHAA